MSFARTFLFVWAGPPHTLGASKSAFIHETTGIGYSPPSFYLNFTIWKLSPGLEIQGAALMDFFPQGSQATEPVQTKEQR